MHCVEREKEHVATGVQFSGHKGIEYYCVKLVNAYLLQHIFMMYSNYTCVVSGLHGISMHMYVY